jgi:hypothetical protein
MTFQNFVVCAYNDPPGGQGRSKGVETDAPYEVIGYIRVNPLRAAQLKPLIDPSGLD